MTIHLHRDLDHVHREMLRVSALVEEMIDKATLALTERRYDLANEVIAADPEVDEHEVHIEEDCLKILALHQPVAIDLRRIATMLKANNDLERIADLAVNIAQRSQAIDEFPTFPIPKRVTQMVGIAVQMVRGALDAFVNLDVQQSQRIMLMDDEVDEHNRLIIDELESLMRANPESVPPALHCFSAVRHIERIADHATNIAEDVIYLVEGEIVRHQHAADSPRSAGAEG